MKRLTPKEFFDSRPPFYVTLDDALTMVSIPEKELYGLFRKYAMHCATASPSTTIISRLVNAFSFDKGRDGDDLTEQNSALKEAQAFLDKINVGK